MHDGVHLDPRRSSTTSKSAESGNEEAFVVVLYFHFIDEVMFSKRRDKMEHRKFWPGGIVEVKHSIFKVNKQKVSTLENNKVFINLHFL